MYFKEGEGKEKSEGENLKQTLHLAQSLAQGLILRT